jgi:hypothetical protein
MITAKLTVEKKKGKELTKAVGEAFAPERTLEINRKVASGDPDGGLAIDGVRDED